MGKTVALCSAVLVSFANVQAQAEEPSVERGLYISIIGGCHDCHTEGYRESGGKIDPARALKGSHIGFQGPWGISYPHNLRLRIHVLSEDGFVLYARTQHAYPPMPYYVLREMTEDDVRSLYRYIVSLGELGEMAPYFVAPGARAKFPYIVLSPPQSPPACTRDLDCSVGEICDASEPRQCVKR